MERHRITFSIYEKLRSNSIAVVWVAMIMFCVKISMNRDICRAHLQCTSKDGVRGRGVGFSQCKFIGNVRQLIFYCLLQYKNKQFIQNHKLVFHLEITEAFFIYSVFSHFYYQFVAFPLLLKINLKIRKLLDLNANYPSLFRQKTDWEHEQTVLMIKYLRNNVINGPITSMINYK